jgi:uncharacterized membrane protein
MKLVPFHVIAGVIAIVAGFVALYAFKGGTLHRKSGTIFAYAMLVMSLSGAVMAVGHAGAAVNIPAGLVTAYLVITSLATVRPASSGSPRLDRAAMVAAFAIGTASLLVAIAGGASRGMTPPLVMFGVVALFAGEGDRRMIRAGGLKGASRLRRHLWRMCAALFIASASFFLGPVRRIPEPLRLPALRLIPLLVLVTMGYWLWRYRRKRISRNVVSACLAEAHAERERRPVIAPEAI